MIRLVEAMTADAAIEKVHGVSALPYYWGIWAVRV